MIQGNGYIQRISLTESVDNYGDIVIAEDIDHTQTLCTIYPAIFVSLRSNSGEVIIADYVVYLEAEEHFKVGESVMLNGKIRCDCIQVEQGRFTTKVWLRRTRK